jgi:hypothetical protein
MSLPSVAAATLPLTVSEAPAVRVTVTTTEVSGLVGDVTGEGEIRDEGPEPPAEVPAATVAAEPPANGVGVITPDGGQGAEEVQ